MPESPQPHEGQDFVTPDEIQRVQNPVEAEFIARRAEESRASAVAAEHSENNVQSFMRGAEEWAAYEFKMRNLPMADLEKAIHATEEWIEETGTPSTEQKDGLRLLKQIQKERQEKADLAK